ncbi:autotransporter outer membrane beta-barrel domain-containing protein, partial [Geminicoccus harenae]
AGAGAVGVLAQSIGGGGGVIGGLSGVDLTQAIRATPVAQSGQGGNVTVDLESGGNIVTSGPGAHVIVAQSLGGGGGILSQPDGSGYAFAGSSPYANCSGPTCTGAVTVTLGGNTVVRPLGEGAYGVVVQSQGNGVNDTTINVNGGFIESWAKSAGAIFIAGAGTNTVNNSGTIDDGSDSSLPGGPTANATGVSITGNQPATINNNSGGTINGSIVLPNGSSALNNNGGTYNPGSTVDLGQDGVLTNAGTVSVGGTGRIRSTALAADYVQTPAGHLLVDTGHVAGTADRLEVSGDVDLAGTITVRPHALIPATVTVLSAVGALDLGEGFGATRSHLFTFTPSLDATGKSVQVTPSADFHVDDDRLSSGQQSLAAHLARLWEGERPESFATGFARLANEARITDSTSYGQALNELSGQSVSAIGASRHQAGQRFVAAMNSCPVFEGDGTRQRERDCGWVRTSGGGSDRKAGGDQLGFIERAVLLQAGGQKEIADGWFLGGSLAYENSTLDARQGAGSAHGDGVLAGLLVKRQFGNWVVSGTLAGGYGWYDSKRHLDLGGIRQTAAASPETQQLGLSTRIAYQLPFEGWYLEPYLDLDATYLRTGSYTESGAGALDLSVDSADDVKFAASPMIELGGRVLLQDGVTLRPYASLGAVFYDDNDWHADTRFAGAPASAGTFQASTELPDTLGRLNLGLELQAADQIQIRLEYAGELGEDYQGHSGTLRFNYLF